MRLYLYIKSPLQQSSTQSGSRKKKHKEQGKNFAQVEKQKEELKKKWRQVTNKGNFLKKNTVSQLK